MAALFQKAPALKLLARPDGALLVHLSSSGALDCGTACSSAACLQPDVGLILLLSPLKCGGVLT